MHTQFVQLSAQVCWTGFSIRRSISKRFLQAPKKIQGRSGAYSRRFGEGSGIWGEGLDLDPPFGREKCEPMENIHRTCRPNQFLAMNYMNIELKSAMGPSETGETARFFFMTYWQLVMSELDSEGGNEMQNA